ncbi:hypothetical protein AAC387_Pa07g0183 [Persea americana]
MGDKPGGSNNGDNVIPFPGNPNTGKDRKGGSNGGKVIQFPNCKGNDDKGNDDNGGGTCTII